MMFLDCPACLDSDGAVRCGLPAEVRCRFTMRSTDGPLESVMIRCPAGHSFTGPVDVLVPKRMDGQDPGRPARRALPAKPDRNVRRPNTAPAYYLGHPASRWIAAMRPRRKLVSAYPGPQR